jgi:hypothetical protein
MARFKGVKRKSTPPSWSIFLSAALLFVSVQALADLVVRGTWMGRPGCGLEDVYKALHQAWRGPGHMIPSREMASAYLRQEWEGLEPAREGEALVETLVIGSPFLRLNLRPFRDAGGSADSLLEAFLRSAAAPTDSVSFTRAWQAVGEGCERGEIPFSRATFDSIDALVRQAGYPAIHHSAAYTSRYRPAYRVLARLEANRLVEGLARRPRPD